MVIASDFKARFTEFNSVDDARIDLFIEDAYLQVGSTWGKLQDLGVLYLSAHLLTLATKSASGISSAVDTVASKSVEGVSISYATQSPTNDKQAYYMTTTYGQRFLELSKMVNVGRALLV